MMRWLGVAAFLVAALLALPVRAQEDPRVTVPYDGPEFFCHILFSKGLTPIGSLDEAEGAPEDSILIVFGDPTSFQQTRFARRRLSQYLAEGGAFLIATDQPTPLRDLSLDIRGQRIYQHEESAYGRAPECPLLSLEKTDHPIFRLLHNKIATNCPSYVQYEGPGPLQTLLRFPADAQFGRRPSGVRLPFARAFPYMVGSAKDAPPAGRTLVIAGHGMFMNSMMLQPDIDNFAFAVNTVEWLRARPGGGKRSKALFIVNGVVIGDFNMNLTPPPPPLPMPTTEMLNRLLRGLEEEGFFHWALARILGEQYDRVVPILIALTTCLLLLYGGKKFLEGRYHHETKVPRMVGLLPPVNVTTTTLGERGQGLLRKKDLAQEAFALATFWMQTEFGVTPAGLASAAGVEFRATGFFLFRRALQRQANSALSMARGERPSAVSRADFASLVRSLPRLSLALREKRLTLLLNGKEVRQTEN